MRSTAIFVFTLVWPFALFSQQLSTDNKKALKLYRDAGVAIKARDFYQGIELYKKALSKDPGFLEASSLYGLLIRREVLFFILV